MSIDELKKRFLEATPPGRQEPVSMFSSLLGKPRSTSPARASAPSRLLDTLRSKLPGVLPSAPAQTDQLKPASDVKAEVSSQVLVMDKATAPAVSKSQESPISKALSTVGGSVFSAFPLFSGIASLFGGSEPASPPPLPHYLPPPAIRFEGAVSSSNPEVIYGVSYGATGKPRASGLVSDFPGVPAGSTTTPARMPVPQITIQVQTMDSRSFLDHSEEIASAVKEALLNSHSLNDVFSEL